MKRILAGSLFLLCSLGLPNLPALADEKQKEAESPVPQVEKTGKENPFMAELREKSEALVAGLDEDELKTLYDIRHLFGMTRSVRVVQRDVEKAVGLCAAENESMESEITSRFDRWDDAVAEAITEAEGKMQVIIAAQAFRPADQINEYLRLTKEAADFTDSQIEKNPVTTEDACRALMQSMDQTQETLTTVLTETSEAAAYPADSYEADPDTEMQDENAGESAGTGTESTEKEAVE